MDQFKDFFDKQMFPCTVGDDEISWWKGEIHHKLHFHMFSCCLALAWEVWIAQIRLFWQYPITLGPLLDCYTNTYFIFCWRKELDGGLGNTYTISKSIVKVIKRILDSLLMLCCFCICNSLDPSLGLIFPSQGLTLARQCIILNFKQNIQKP